MALPTFIGRVSNAVGAVAGIPRERLLSILEGEVVRLEFTDAVADHQPLADAAHLIANLAARLYPTIELAGPDRVVEECGEIASGINPDIDLQAAPSSRSPHVLRFGPNGGFCSDGVSVQPSGWSVYVDRDPPHEEPPVSFAALGAACVGAAELFRTVFAPYLGPRGRKERQPGALDLLTLEEPRPDPSLSREVDFSALDLGSLHLAGAGAIGQACVLALAACGARGEMTVVDPEAVELSNLQRYVLTTIEDVNESKADLAAKVLATGGWRATPVETVWGADAQSDPGRRCVLVALDSAAGRLGVAAGLHARTYNAFTQPADLGWSRHELFGSEPCLACLYYPDRRRPSEDELVAQALHQPRLRVLSYFATNAPVGVPLPGVAEAAGMPAPPDAARWTSVSILEDLVRSGRLAESEASEWAARTIGQLYTEGLCGGGVVSFDGTLHDQAVVPLAHQSALAGVMLALLPVAATVPELRARRPSAIEGRIDLNRGLPQVVARPRTRTHGCICSDTAYVAAARGLA